MSFPSLRKWFVITKTVIQRIRNAPSTFRDINKEHQDYRKAQQARLKRAESLFTSLSPATRIRFNDDVLINLLDAGWHEGRAWDGERLSEFQRLFSSNPPSTAQEVLKEFGGLEIGLSGRTIQIGEIKDRLCAYRQKLASLVGPTLYPIGQTNIFEDDGLGVHIDEEGRVFIDGPTGHDPPHDYRIELIASGFDFFLHLIFSRGPTPSLASWDYTETDMENSVGS
jgi:hypothetical protein